MSKFFPIRRGLLEARKSLAFALDRASGRLHSEPSPSFLRKYSAHRQSYAGALALVGRDWGELWEWESKAGNRALAGRLGIRTPRIIREAAPIDALSLEGLPSAFVVKPDRGASANGVFVLRRTGDSFDELLTQRRGLGLDEIQSSLRELAHRGRISGDRILIEEAILDDAYQLACDWKVYAFQGEVGVVRQIVRSDGVRRTMTYGPEWEEIVDARRDKAEAPLFSPRNPEKLLNAARRFSVNVPVPFLRVDLYERGDEVLLGELTPMPGMSGQRFAKKLDIHLGRLWRQAESRLLATGAGGRENS